MHTHPHTKTQCIHHTHTRTHTHLPVAHLHTNIQANIIVGWDPLPTKGSETHGHMDLDKKTTTVPKAKDLHKSSQSLIHGIFCFIQTLLNEAKIAKNMLFTVKNNATFASVICLFLCLLSNMLFEEKPLS